MKAKEYFKKYKDEITNESEEIASEAAGKLCFDLLVEAKEICKIRNVKLDRGLEAVIREQNQKANAIARMFDPPVLKKDFFMVAYSKTMNSVKGGSGQDEESKY